MPDPLDAPPQAVIDYLGRAARWDENGVPTFYDDRGVPHYALDREGCPPMTAREVAAWTRTAKPELWREKPAQTVDTPPAEPALAPAVAASPLTVSETMLAVRAGTMTLDAAHAAVARHFNPRETASAPVNFTDLMTRARAGDTAARAELDRALSR